MGQEDQWLGQEDRVKKIFNVMKGRQLNDVSADNYVANLQMRQIELSSFGAQYQNSFYMYGECEKIEGLLVHGLLKKH